MILVATERVKVGLVRILELAFQTNSQFRWSPDINATQVTIFKQWPLVDVKLPAIIVSSTPGDAMERTIGQELRRQVTSSKTIEGVEKQVVTAIKYGGTFEPSVTIEVACNDTMTRDRVVDWIAIYIRWFFWEKFRQFGINFQSMRFLSDREERLGTGLVQVSGLSLDLLTEWNHTICIDDANRIDAITITNIFIINYNGTTSV